MAAAGHFARSPRHQVYLSGLVNLIECGPQDSNLQPRDSRAPVFPRGLDYLILLEQSRRNPVGGKCPESFLMRDDKEAGRSRRGLLLGLTPLVSEPSWPPLPGQAWLRIAIPVMSRHARAVEWPKPPNQPAMPKPPVQVSRNSPGSQSKVTLRCHLF